MNTEFHFIRQLICDVIMCEDITKNYVYPIPLLMKLNKLWESKKVKEVDNLLSYFFKHTKCQLSMCLELIQHSRNKKKPNSLGNHIMDQFKDFLVANDVSGDCVSEELKRDALEVALCCHQKLALKLIKCFSIDVPSLGLIRERIKDMYTLKGNLNEAISLTTALNMQDAFTIFDMAVPAYLQNKINLLESYMQGSEKATVEMLKLVDSWLVDFDVALFCADHGIRNVKGEALKPQFHDKSLGRWLKLFSKESSAAELCPNLCRRRAVGAMKYLLYRHYVEKSATLENTLDLLKKSVGDDEALQEELLYLLRNSYCDYEALDIMESWFKTTLPLPASADENKEEDWGEIADGNTKATPSSCSRKRTKWKKLAVHFPVRRAGTTEASVSVIKEPFHTLKLSDDCITIVDDFKSLNYCRNIILENVSKVGVDAEWCISTGKFHEKQSVALLQLATMQHVFLVDLYVLVQSNFIHIMSNFLIQLFSSKTIIKIGFGLGEDLKKVSLTVPGLESLSQTSCRIIDLHVLSNKLKRVCPQALNPNSESYPSSITGKDLTGLSKLVMQTLGLPLNKGEQISDWERRPLRPAQIKYAALDSYCLLEIYEVLSSRILRAGLATNLEDILHNKMNNQKSATQRSHGLGRGALLKKYASASEKTEETPLLSADKFRVVCDNMLQGVGRRLRGCGIDTRILTNLEDHDLAGKIAQRDDRVILTSGTPFQTLSSQVAVGRCFDVPNDVKVNQQVAAVIEHFNVKINISDIFSRCQLCNSGKYFVVSSEDMFKLIKQNKACPETKATSPIPWDQYRSSEPSQKPDHLVVLEDDLNSDGDDPYVYDDRDVQSTKDQENIPEAAAKPCIVGPEIERAEEAVSTSDTFVPRVKVSTRPPYLIKSSSLSNTSTLDFKNIAIATKQPDTGQVTSTPILCKQVPLRVCRQVTEFYCCVGCGKVYWEGAHFGNAIRNYSDILSS